MNNPTEEFDKEVIEAAIQCGIEIDDIDEAYCGEFVDDKDFAYEQADACGMIDEDAKWPHSCIDWEHAARELMYDYTEYRNHYFRNL
jgi:antirestriction protein